MIAKKNKYLSDQRTFCILHEKDKTVKNSVSNVNFLCKETGAEGLYPKGAMLGILLFFRSHHSTF